jgi:hypothetical protein
VAEFHCGLPWFDVLCFNSKWFVRQVPPAICATTAIYWTIAPKAHEFLVNLGAGIGRNYPLNFRLDRLGDAGAACTLAPAAQNLIIGHNPGHFGIEQFHVMLEHEIRFPVCLVCIPYAN